MIRGKSDSGYVHTMRIAGNVKKIHILQYGGIVSIFMTPHVKFYSGLLLLWLFA